MFTTSQVLQTPRPDEESVAFTRYADRVRAEEKETVEKLQHPRGKPFQRVNPAEMWRVQKHKEHWEQVSRSKAFMADEFFPPRQIPNETNLKELFLRDDVKEVDMAQQLIEIIPNLNHD